MARGPAGCAVTGAAVAMLCDIFALSECFLFNATFFVLKKVSNNGIISGGTDAVCRKADKTKAKGVFYEHQIL